MNKTNPIFEALNELNENYAAEAVMIPRKKMKKTLKIVLITAAAAALALMVGFTTAAVRGQHKFNFGVGDSANYGFYFNLTSQEFTIPDEFMSELHNGMYRDYVDTPPSELFREFGIAAPLINDNFTDTDKKTRVDILYISDSNSIVDFDYCLYDKNLGKNIFFKAEYVSDISMYESEGTYWFQDENEPHLITLNDGSRCLVTNYMAVFSYGGVRYELNFDDADNPVEAVNQALADLGVL